MERSPLSLEWANPYAALRCFDCPVPALQRNSVNYPADLAANMNIGGDFYLIFSGLSSPQAREVFKHLGDIQNNFRCKFRTKIRESGAFYSATVLTFCFDVQDVCTSQFFFAERRRGRAKNKSLTSCYALGSPRTTRKVSRSNTVWLISVALRFQCVAAVSCYTPPDVPVAPRFLPTGGASQAN